MRRAGENKLSRLMAFILALLLMLPALPASARTAAGWEGVTVSVVWTDAQGGMWVTPAWRVPEGTTYDGKEITNGWWATLPEEALGTVVSLEILHPDPAYTYWLTDWSLQLQWLAEDNAQDLHDDYAQYVGYTYNGTHTTQLRDLMKLYLSTTQPPFEVPEEELNGGTESIVPQPGFEVIVPGPGVDVIVPGPAPAPVQTVISVYYKLENGKLLDMKEITLGEGYHEIWPQSNKVSGYELVGAYSYPVNVYAGGSDVASVTFTYREAVKAPAQAQIDVYYVHEDGGLLDQKRKTLTEGVHTLYPESSAVGGYELSSDSAVRVEVYSDGSTDLASVTFYYRDAFVAPAQAVVPVYYYHQDGYLLDTVELVLPEGKHVVTPQSSAVKGLELIGADSVNVTVDRNGRASVANVTFLYWDPYVAPVTAEVNVYYYDTMGNEIAPRQKLTLAPGVHPIRPEAAGIPSDYELVSDKVFDLTVYADGTIDRPADEVGFWYTKKQTETIEPVVPGGSSQTGGIVDVIVPVQKSASVSVIYRDSRGMLVGQETRTLSAGTHSISPDLSKVPAGYSLFQGTPDTATVTVSNGRANPDTVTFYVMQIVQTPSTYPVDIYYYDTMGNEIAPRQTRNLAPGQHRIEAKPERLPAGYELATDAAFTLTVYNDGTFDRAAEDVGFWYAPVQTAPKVGKVTVQYVDANGRVLAGPFSFELTGGQTYTLAPDAMMVPEGYDPNSASEVKVRIAEDGTATPSTVLFTLSLQVDSSVPPVGQEIARYGLVNDVNVAVRTEPSSASGNKTVIFRAKKGSTVYMVSSEYNAKGELWTKVLVDGRDGYMLARYIDMLTQKASDVFAQSTGATPVPTITPVPTPTPTPTEVFIELITPVPVTATPYAGYAMTITRTPLRTGMSSMDLTQRTMDMGELVIVRSAMMEPYTGVNWCIVQTLGGESGYVKESALRRVTDQEADWHIQLWQQQNATPAPTQLVTSTPEPEQLQGYAYTLMNNVPFRQMASEQSRIIDNLPYATVVYITGQVYSGGLVWHSVALDGEWGYIREDLLRLMTIAEENAYLDSLFATPTPTLATTNRPYDEAGLSSYGYVDASSVNFRNGPSMQAKKVGELKRYAMCLILDTEYAEGVTWYSVDYEGSRGYIHGDYFHHMTLREFGEFYKSDLYYQGIDNNREDKTQDDEPYYGDVSAEDQIVDNWYASGGESLNNWPSFVSPVTPIPPIQPTATPTLAPTPTLEPIVPGGMNAPGGTGNSSSGENLPQNSGGTGMEGSSSSIALPGESDRVEEIDPGQSNGGINPLVAGGVLLLLLLTGGGVFIAVQHQRKKRRIAMRAAQRRAQQARSADRPVARVNPQMNRTGAYPAQTSAQRPYQNGYTQKFAQNTGVQQPVRQESRPYSTDVSAGPVNPAPASRTAQERPYARTETQPSAAVNLQPVRKPGRRTAYQQALAEKQASQKTE